MKKNYSVYEEITVNEFFSQKWFAKFHHESKDPCVRICVNTDCNLYMWILCYAQNIYIYIYIYISVLFSFIFFFFLQISMNVLSIMAVVFEHVTILQDPSLVTAHRNISWDLTIGLALVSDDKLGISIEDMYIYLAQMLLRKAWTRISALSTTKHDCKINIV